MKIKALAALCKSNKSIYIYDLPDGDKTAQWIGEGAGLYPITGLPYLSEENVCCMFDVPEDKRPEWTIVHDEMPNGFNMDDVIQAEQELATPEIEIKYQGRMLIPFNTSAGTRLIDRTHLAPIANELKLTTFYERRTPEGGVYIACKVGFLLRAVILPAFFADKNFNEHITNLARRVEYAYNLTAMRKSVVAQHIDRETGEIVDDVENGMVVGM